MIFKFTLYHEIEGEKVISEPEGWATSVVGVERHPDFRTLVEYFESSFSAYGIAPDVDGGRDWILNIEKLYGPDALVKATIDFSDTDEGAVRIFTGTQPIGLMSQSLKEDNFLDIVFAADDLWATFINRYQTPVDIRSAKDLDDNDVEITDPLTIKLPSQPINKHTTYIGHTGEDNTVLNCFVATTANISLAGNQTIDGEFTSDFMRVLVKNQTDPKENGPYNASSVGWTRTTDANTGSELDMLIVQIDNGTVNSGKTFKQQTPAPTLGSSNIVFAQYNYVDDVELLDNPFGGLHHMTSSSEILPDLYYTPATANLQQKEIDDSFTNGFALVLDPIDISNSVEIQQENGKTFISCNIKFALGLKGSFFADEADPGPDKKWWFPKDVNVVTDLYYKINDDAPVSMAFDFATGNFTSTLLPNPPNPAQSYAMKGIAVVNSTCSNIALELKPSDILTVYARHTISVDYFEYGTTGGNINASFWYADLKVVGGIQDELVDIKFVSLTPATSAQGFYIHDIGANIIKRICGGNFFYSALLGSPKTLERVYAEQGNYWNYVGLRGLQIRQYAMSLKPFSISMEDWWKCFNPIFNFALGLNTVGGQQVIEVTKQRDQFRTDQVSTRLSNVRQITRSYDKKYYYNQINVGYNKWESEDVQGIDDPQSVHVYASILKRIGTPLTLISNAIAASLRLERCRREVKTKSADYKDDNETFIVAVSKTEPSVTPSLDESFTSVTGLENEELRYNKELTPGRMLLRWLYTINGGLQSYLTSTYKFVSGQGNFDMASTMVDNGDEECFDGANLSEKQNVPVTNDFIFVPMPYEIIHYLTRQQYIDIINNKDLCIEISQTEDNYTKFSIEKLEYVMATGDLKLIAVSREPFEIKVVENDNNEQPNFFQRIFTSVFDSIFN